MNQFYQKIFTLIFFLTIMISFTYAQEEYLSKNLKPIKENFQRINSTTQWSKTKKIDLWETPEGGHATFYYSRLNLEKIVVRKFGETFQNITEYYLLNGQLSFVFDQNFKYNRPLLWDSVQMKENNDDQVWDFDKSEIEENRSYFERGKLISQLNNQDCGSPFSDEYLKNEGTIILAEFQRIVTIGEEEK